MTLGVLGRAFAVFLGVSQMNKNIQRGLLAVGVLASVGAANAAVDITAATTGIGDAQTAVLAVLGTMITMAAAIFGVRKVLKFLGGK